MINLKTNYPSIEEEAIALEDYIRTRKNDYLDFLEFPDYQGTKENIRAAAKWLKLPKRIYRGISDISTCNSGNHALNCILECLKHNHHSILTEPFTYPGFKNIALNKGFTLYTSSFDEQGLTVEALEENIEITGAKIIYLQPTLHNPTCAVMGLSRRRGIAALAKRKNILIIEDDAYRFLEPLPLPSFLELLPENTLHIFSLSKAFNPFIKTAFVICPNSHTDKIKEEIRLTSSGNSSLLSSLAAHILNYDILNAIIIIKQEVANEIQEQVLPLLKGLKYYTHPNSFHIWIELPEHTNSHLIVNALLNKDILISSGLDFEVGDLKDGERFIRIALGSERDVTKIKKGMQEVVNLIN